MKKVLMKIVIVFMIFMIGVQQFVFADIIINGEQFKNPFLEEEIRRYQEFVDKAIKTQKIISMVMLLSLACIIISIVCIIVLRKIKKKDKDNIYVKVFKIILYVSTIIWSILMCRNLCINLIDIYFIDKINFYVFIIPLIIYVLSIVRSIMKKTLFNIFYIIFIISIIIMPFCLKTYEHIIYERNSNFNNQFIQYMKFVNDDSSKERYITDVKGLIETTIDNNTKNSKKVTIGYNGGKYIDVDELKELKNKIKKEICTIGYSYESGRKENKINYIGIESGIKLLNPIFKELLLYECENKNYEEIENNIKEIQKTYKEFKGYKGNKISLIHKNGDTIIDNIDSKVWIEVSDELSKAINKSGKHSIRVIYKDNYSVIVE